MSRSWCMGICLNPQNFRSFWWVAATLGLVAVAGGLLPVAALAQAVPAEAARSVEYRSLPYVGSRNLVWFVAQIHLLFGGFVLGVPMFALVCEIVGHRSGDPRYDRLAKEFTKLLTASFGTTATFGAILLFLLLGLYPRVIAVMTDVFFPTYIVYALLFIGETVTLYLYWYGWDAMAAHKGLHIGLGFLLNAFGVLILMTSDAWLTYQASPVVLSEDLGAWARAWAAVNNPTWWPVNIHRLIGNVVLGGFICGAYAGVRYLSATTQEEREHYDWMGYVGNFVGIFGLLTLPFAGYWLMREIYQFNQQMGITLMGGILSWLFILQAVQIGVLFLGANYYFWQGIAYRTSQGPRLKKVIMTMLVVLLICLGIWMTPHSLVVSVEEARKLGGTHHPLLGVFGVMSAKMTAVNIIILTTFLSFLLYWRADKVETVRWASAAKSFQALLFAVAAVAVIGLGIYGYYVPAIIRVNYLSVMQVLAVLFVLLTVTPLTAAMMKTARLTGRMRWGMMPPRSQYILILNGVMIILIMTLMGYARSASRVHFHIYGVLRDTSPEAFTPTLGTAATLMAAITFVFCLIVSFIFWVAGLPDKAGKKSRLEGLPPSMAPASRKP